MSGMIDELAKAIWNMPMTDGDPTMQDTMTAAARDVLAERERQMQQEGWTHENDDQYQDGALANAAACYASTKHISHLLWPWDARWFKLTSRRRDLVKAGALILAEIERLDRAASKPS